MAQPPPDQNFYHHHHHPHTHPHAQSHPHSHQHPHPQLQLPPQFRNPFDLLFDDRTSTINYNYIRPYIPNQLHKPDDLSDSLVMRRPRRTRTTFTSTQIAELEQHFLQGRYLTSSRLAELSAKLALGTAQVKIWFKNRRRRHKIQSDQQKDHPSSFTCDGMPMSPSMSSGIKSEAQLPSLQSLTLGCNGGSVGGSTPITLTPSPTPTTPTTNLIDHYGDSFGQYYYNNNHNIQPPLPPPSHVHHPHHTQSAAIFPSRSTNPTLHHQHQHQHQQHQQHPHQHQHSLHHPQHQGHYNGSYHQYEFQHKSLNPNSVVGSGGGNGGCGSALKKETDFNFNNPYYIRMSAVAAPTAVTAGAAMTASTTNADDGKTTSTAMSPNCEVYEPLTPKNDESPSLCNGGGVVNNGGSSVDTTDDMDDESNSKSLQTLAPPSNNNGRNGGGRSGSGDDACGSGISMSANANDGIMEDCTGAFSKYTKLANDMHETNNYQCTMDTIMHAYNSHRNSAGSTQFAYCFN